SISDTIFVSEPPAIAISGDVVNATCDAADGSIDVTASGGTGDFTYSWDSGEDTSSIDNLPSGTYTVTITDENGCTAEAAYEVSGVNPLDIEFSTQNLLCFNDSTGEISANVLNA